MANPIVQINVSVTNPPAPSNLLRTGAIVSQGGTSLTPGTYSLLTQNSVLTPLLTAGKAITSAVWSGGVVTVTTTAPHGYPSAETIGLTIAGMTPAAYNGTFQATITGTTTFTYPLASNPGTATVFGIVTDADVAELIAQVTTFFAQGKSASVYVLEFGPGVPADGVTALGTYINTNPQFFFSYLVPREWDTEPTFKTFVGQFNTPSALVKFFVTTTISTYTNWTSLNSCVFAHVEAPGLPATEFTCAAAFYVTLNYNPSSAQQVGPLCFSFVYGVTPYPTVGNSALLTSLKAANINYVATAAEGGLTNTMLVWGHMLDGNPFNYWYTIAWAIINLDANIANEVINGSNNVLAPLYYNQQGITRLENRGAQTLRSGVSYGLILGQVIVVSMAQADFVAAINAGTYAGNAVINAIPFASYNSANPSDYSIGKYAGLSAALTPARGFEQIIFNLNVTNFVS